MNSNKDRLYLALDARAGRPKMQGLEDTYHWALIVGPKNEKDTSPGRRFHAKETMTVTGTPPTPRSVWVYEEVDISMALPYMLLARIVVAKIKDRCRIQSILKDTPLRPEVEGWNCVWWVQEALENACRDPSAIGSCIQDWESVRDTAMWYVTKKRAENRFDGSVPYDSNEAPTWDMLEGKEVFS